MVHALRALGRDGEQLRKRLILAAVDAQPGIGVLDKLALELAGEGRLSRRHGHAADALFMARSADRDLFGRAPAGFQWWGILGEPDGDGMISVVAHLNIVLVGFGGGTADRQQRQNESKANLLHGWEYKAFGLLARDAPGDIRRMRMTNSKCKMQNAEAEGAWGSQDQGTGGTKVQLPISQGSMALLAFSLLSLATCPSRYK